MKLHSVCSIIGTFCQSLSDRTRGVAKLSVVKVRDDQKNSGLTEVIGCSAVPFQKTCKTVPQNRNMWTAEGIPEAFRESETSWRLFFCGKTSSSTHHYRAPLRQTTNAQDLHNLNFNRSAHCSQNFTFLERSDTHEWSTPTDDTRLATLQEKRLPAAPLLEHPGTRVVTWHAWL